jgi:hypothetical protein
LVPVPPSDSELEPSLDELPLLLLLLLELLDELETQHTTRVPMQVVATFAITTQTIAHLRFTYNKTAGYTLRHTPVLKPILQTVWYRDSSPLNKVFFEFNSTPSSLHFH